jgi:hypothetical protein
MIAAMAGASAAPDRERMLALSSTRRPIDRSPADDAMWSGICLGPPDRPEEETTYTNARETTGDDCGRRGHSDERRARGCAIAGGIGYRQYVSDRRPE